MANATQLQTGGVVYQVKDATARQDIATLQNMAYDNHNYENNVNEVLGKQTGERQVFWYSSTNIDPEHAYNYVSGNIGGRLSFSDAISHAVLKIKNPWIARIVLPITETEAIAQVFIVRDSDGVIIGSIKPSQTQEVSQDIAYSLRSTVTYYINWFNAYTDQSVFPQYCYFLYEDDNPYDFLSKYSPFLESSTMFGDYGVTRQYLFSNCLVQNGWVSVGTNGTMIINNPQKPATHRHLLISSRNIKKITLTGGSAAPAVHYGFWFEDPINGGQTQAILGLVAEPTYTFANPTDGYIAFNNFGNGDYATGFEIEYWSGEELYGGNKRYHNSVRKPFAFSGKTAVFTGDSITAGFTSGTTTTQNGYPKLFSDAVGLSFTNAGVGGATIARVTNYPCIQDQVANANKTIDFLFIAGGVNDWQLNVAFDTFEAAVETLCQYINNNFPATTQVIWITPINHAGWDITHPATRVGNVQDYRNMLTRVVTMNDTLSRFSIVQGDEFNFPTADDAESYWSVAFGDRLHPSELGYKNIYTPGLLNALQ